MSDTLQSVRDYWDRYVSGLQVPGEPWGSPGFFRQIKEAHQPAYAVSTRLLQLPRYRHRRILEVGCGLGLDVVEYLHHGAQVTAIDVSFHSLELARRLLVNEQMTARLLQADAEELPFPDEVFDLVVARGVLMYTPRTRRAVDEVYRVLRPGGEMLAILHNRRSWFAILARATGTNLYHEGEDPPVNRLHTRRQVRRLFDRFDQVRITHDKFPAPTDRRHGLFAGFYNSLFVPLVRILPRAVIRPWGYYLIVQGVKE
jgi:SAM-dependent methyltransferase